MVVSMEWGTIAAGFVGVGVGTAVLGVEAEPATAAVELLGPATAATFAEATGVVAAAFARCLAD